MNSKLSVMERRYDHLVINQNAEANQGSTNYARTVLGISIYCHTSPRKSLQEDTTPKSDAARANTKSGGYEHVETTLA